MRPTRPDPAKPWLEACRLHLEERDYDAAEGTLRQGLAVLPDHMGLQSAWARLAGRQGDWPEAVERWQELLRTRIDEFSAGAWVSAAHSHRRIGELEAAESLISRALDRFPRREPVLWEASQIAMSREDWDAAVVRWVRWWRANIRKRPDALRPLPRRARSDWFEGAWHEVVEHLDSGSALLERPPGPRFHVALAQVLARSDMPEEEMRVLERGIKHFPDDIELAHVMASALLGRGLVPPDLPLTDDELRAIQAALPGYDPAAHEGLGPIRLLRVPAGSSVELALRIGTYLDRTAVRRIVEELSQRDRWPETFGSTDVLMDRARAFAAEYAASYAVPPHLPAETLADTLLVSIYHEASHLVPMTRLAEDVAERTAGAPVVVEIPSTQVGYLEIPSTTQFAPIYLYFALLERGCNAFLCVIEPHAPEDDEPPVFEFQPSWRIVEAQIEVHDDPAPGAVAVVPAGIRAIKRLVEQLGDVVVYQSGSVVKEFAYDRSLEQDHPVVATASLHADPERLPPFVLDLETVATIDGFSLVTEDRRPAATTVEVTEPLGGTWASWLHRATGEFVEHLAAAAADDVARRGVTEVHVADYMLPEGMIIGDAVRRRGGTVLLRPHSSNPVHPDVRRADSFDEVYAVTRTGAETWRTRFPDKVVHHSPASMILPGEPRPFTEGEPLSVVLFGGLSTMGSLPILDTAAHRALYRDLFEGFERLHNDGLVNVYFKPRGNTAESEQWLYNTVGKKAMWRPIQEHSLRMSLPNMLFVSVSLGTSALFEGLSRGVPGLVVRDFPVRDYTTLDAATFPILSLADALAFVEDCTSEEGYAAVVRRELAYAQDEIGLTNGGSEPTHNAL